MVWKWTRFCTYCRKLLAFTAIGLPWDGKYMASFRPPVSHDIEDSIAFLSSNRRANTYPWLYMPLPTLRNAFFPMCGWVYNIASLRFFRRRFLPPTPPMIHCHPYYVNPALAGATDTSNRNGGHYVIQSASRLRPVRSYQPCISAASRVLYGIHEPLCLPHIADGHYTKLARSPHCAASELHDPTLTSLSLASLSSGSPS